LARAFLERSQHSLLRHHLPRLERAVRLLSDADVWWRPNAASNSAGNLLLHLEGNVRQWIISGLGRAPDHRQRDLEFAERGPLPRRRLLTRLRKTVREACAVIGGLSAADLGQRRTIQGLTVTALEAIHHVVEHFAYHTGQVLYIAKLRSRRDLGFTRLPGQPPPPASKGRPLPVL
jgi:uncharacterized damage-inducible protein DinB